MMPTRCTAASAPRHARVEGGGIEQIAAHARHAVAFDRPMAHQCPQGMAAGEQCIEHGLADKAGGTRQEDFLLAHTLE